ncbi:MAG: LysM peptidoglycan-binding domain-containing protein [Methylocystis sp.]|uniref:LysM peptidoglycan-binding domain-containing protein n=1 Tax=Methylocystis sp. TaxID=1911079 RepID=UPI003DA1CD62
MNPDLLSANVSMALMVVLAAALLAHLSQFAGPNRFLHLAQAATAAGLLCLLGMNAFGWSFLPREALMIFFAALFVGVAAAALMARARRRAAESSWRGLLIEMAAMAYIFAPIRFWKPPLSALLMIFFLLELLQRLKGSEPVVADAAGQPSGRPPLFPPRRVRGAREFALAAAAAAMVYVFAMGTAKQPVVAPAPEQTSTAEPAAEQPVEQSAPADAQQSAEATTQAQPEPAPPAAQPAPETPPPPKTYTASAGETLRSIARKLSGKAENWRTLAAANPGVKPSAKLKAGQLIKLPPPPEVRPE